MSGRYRHCLGCRLTCASIIFLSVCAAAQAEDSTASIKDAEQYLATGNLKAAEVQFKKAVRQSPQDPVIRARLAEVYLRLDDAASAEREARAARERGGDETDYLPILADALLRQYKFADVLDLIRPGDRAPVLESRIRTALGTAAGGLRDQVKTEAMLREAIRLDPRAVSPKTRLAQFLNAKDPA